MNRDLEVIPDEVLMFGDAGYLPKDRNWVQIHLVVKNKRNKVITLTDIKSRQSNGIALDTAGAAQDLAKAPDLGKNIGTNVGLQVAGSLAGYVFLPLGILGGVASMVHGVGGASSWQHRQERINANLLKSGDIAPETATQGYIYIPATTTQSALVVIYHGDGGSQSLSMSGRMVQAPPAVPKP